MDNCFGPTGSCDLDFGHGGDHIRPRQSGNSIRRADLALSRSLAGLCAFCGLSLDDDFRCAADCQGDRQ